ncbi:MAG: GUN4 domain-containing protein [Gomphosphaeria aponina SAG 52.96 = DSM 107014]|uniref:non-specific serine/threonine protein kinase n=1 Tax=Gomphosphaeria aponina SAG 52.96 = DSM 107014 TaxID=1521640 RepID=A0A941JUH4_9CHRO|nr:GUN4 domain-containing protein [Gomphosphaeria aponina SAG 52.96 = DSM 107014]
MSHCLNPECLHKNPLGTKLCERCGSKILLWDRYRAVHCIGAGGMGRTFLAVDQHRLNSRCVIKQFIDLKQAGRQRDKLIKLFKQEAIRLDELGEHPQIPDLLAFKEQEGRLYLVQEFINGQDLLRELDKEGLFTEEKVIKILNDLLPVLEFIHKKNIIHRDIKPANIIRNEQGDLVLIDFGVAKELTDTALNSQGTIVGTAAYAAPEQLQGMAFPASDLYGLGATCIRLLTGAFRKSDGSDELFDPLKMEWKWRHKTSTSENLGNVLDKLVQYRVSDRFHTAAEVLTALAPQPIKLNRPPQPPPPPAPMSKTGLRKYRSTFSTTKTPFSPEEQPTKINEKRNQLPVAEPTTFVIPAVTAVSIPSDVSADYTKLRDLLHGQKYLEADRETYKLMLRVARRDPQGWLRPEDLEKFPCTDLKILDQLWGEYSGGRFGFTMQKQIYQSLGGTEKYHKQIWLEFCKQVGWLVGEKWLTHSQLNFQRTARIGHLPVANATDLMGGMVVLNTNLIDHGYFTALIQKIGVCC